MADNNKCNCSVCQANRKNKKHRLQLSDLNELDRWKVVTSEREFFKSNSKRDFKLREKIGKLENKIFELQAERETFRKLLEDNSAQLKKKKARYNKEDREFIFEGKLPDMIVRTKDGERTERSVIGREERGISRNSMERSGRNKRNTMSSEEEEVIAMSSDEEEVIDEPSPKKSKKYSYNTRSKAK